MIAERSKYRLILRFFLIYLLVLLMQVLIGVFTYNSMLNIVEKVIVDANMIVLNQGMRIIDKSISDIDKLVYATISDPKIRDFKNVTKPFSGSNVMRVLENKKQLEKYKVDSEFVLDSIILFKSNNTVFNFDSVFHMSEFYGNFFEYEGVGFNTWYNTLLNKYAQKAYLPAQKVTIRDKSYTAITYVNSIGYSFKIQGAVLYLLDSNYILNLFNGLDLKDGGWIYLEDNKGQIIYSFGADAESVKPIINAGVSGIVQYKHADQNMMVTYTTSPYNGWKYVVVQPAHIVNAKLHNLTQTTLTIAIVYLLLGIGVSFVLAYRNGKPLQDTLSILKKRLNSDGKIGHTGNTYRMLQSTISSLVDNHEALEARIQEQKPFMTHAFYESLFRGEFSSEEEIKGFARHISLNISKQAYVVVVLWLNRAIPQSADYSLGNLDFQCLIVKDIIIQILGDEAIIHQNKADKMTLLVSSDLADEDSFKQDLTQKINGMINELNSQIDADLVAGAGNIYDTLINISRSYNEANLALSQYYGERREKVIWYAESHPVEKGYYMPKDMETRLINHINSGDKLSINHIFDEIYKENFVIRGIPVYVMQLFISNMYSILMSVMDKLSIRDEVIWNDLSMVMHHMEHGKEEIRHLYSNIRTHYDRICDMIEERKNSHSDKLVTEIKEFINNSYSDCGFNLSAVSDRFHMSQTYASQFIKEHVGITFSEYLEEIRMNQARQLLCLDKEPISVIAQSVGYSSISTFARAFKRRYGISARDYKISQKGSPN